MSLVLLVGVACGVGLMLSIPWRPGRGFSLLRGVQGGLLGGLLSCSLASLLARDPRHPYLLPIYTLGFNLLLTPVLAATGFMVGWRTPKPRPASPLSTSFEEVFREVTEGPDESTAKPCPASFEPP